MSAKLVAFGNVLLDFTYNVEKNHNLLAQYGFDPNGLGECSSETLAIVGNDAQNTCEFLSSQTGGSALNTSKILSQLGETDVIFCGAIGNDRNGEIVKKQLEESHLKSHLQVFENHPTGTAICLINKENRCCYANIGASIRFEVNFLRNLHLVEPNAKACSQIFYIESFFLTGNRFSVCKTIIDEMCTPPSGPGIFATNLSAKYLIESYTEKVKYLAEHATILFGNDSEFNKLAETYQMSNAREVIPHLLRFKTGNAEKMVICTQGSKSVLYATTSAMCQIKEFPIEAMPKEEIIDTTGCGDAFVAGFFYAFLRNESIERCVAKGAEVARKKITSIGGNFSK